MKPVVVEHLLSGLVAAGLATALLAAGLPTHLLHARVAATEERALLAVTRTLGNLTPVPGSPRAATIPYADTKEGCAASAWLVVRTTLDPGAVLSEYGGKGLPNLTADLVGHDRVRVETVRPFGMNPFDWSCWT